MKNSKSITILLTLAIALFSFSTIQAQHSTPKFQAATARHGGIVKEANGLTMEMVPNEKGVQVYMLDAQGKPKGNKGVTGTATFTFEDKTTKTETLKPANDDHFIVQTGFDKPYTMKVELTEKGTKHSASFSPDETAQATYICPMKCEGSASNKSGSCPKCGMALVKAGKSSKSGHEGHGH